MMAVTIEMVVFMGLICCGWVVASIGRSASGIPPFHPRLRRSLGNPAKFLAFIIQTDLNRGANPVSLDLLQRNVIRSAVVQFCDPWGLMGGDVSSGSRWTTVL